MQQLFELIGWSVLLPPVVQDHDGVGHNLLGLDPTALEHLLHDAWAQFVARQVRHRKPYNTASTASRRTTLPSL